MFINKKIRRGLPAELSECGSVLIDFLAFVVHEHELVLPCDRCEGSALCVTHENDLDTLGVFPNLVVALAVASKVESVELADFRLLTVVEVECDGVDCLGHLLGVLVSHSLL